jgi:predicted dehydrogenase
LKRYRDYREMLDKQKDIDAIVVATPDHMHAVIALAAMDLDKHVYVQKPLCWSVEEARALERKAKEKPTVVTQMGNQGHSSDGSRTAARRTEDARGQQDSLRRRQQAHHQHDQGIGRDDNGSERVPPARVPPAVEADVAVGRMAGHLLAWPERAMRADRHSSARPLRSITVLAVTLLVFGSHLAAQDADPINSRGQTINDVAVFDQQ